MSSSVHRSASAAHLLVGFLVTASIVLVCFPFGGVALGSPALAVPALPSPLPLPSTEAEAAEEEGEEWESETEAEEEDEEEFEAGGSADPTVLPPECVLRTADPSVVAAHNRLQLKLPYTSEAPVKVGVEYWLKGGKGALQLGSAKRRLGKRGVLRMNRHLDEREVAKVRAARLIMLHLDVPGVGSYCKPFLTFRLGAKQQGDSRTTFSQLRERRY